VAQGIQAYAIGGKPAVGPKALKAVIEGERRQYSAAARLVCRSHWSAKAAVEQYGIDPRKVHIVPGGANLPDLSMVAPTRTNLEPLRLGFIGKDWKRKNLPFLIEVAEALDSRGIRVEVVAAGFDPAQGPQHRLLRSIGFLDKQDGVNRFVKVVENFHFGCLFSIAEAFGISNLECIRLGVPVLAWDVGGIADTVPTGLGHLFPPEVAAVDVADIVQSYVREPDAYWTLRKHVFDRRLETTWSRTVAKLLEVWNGSQEYCYAALASS
jgi:glycosyltransferase involved in cell wall biosynthesis